MQAKLATSETEKQLAVAKAVEQKNDELSKRDSEIAKLNGQLSVQRTENQLSEKSLKEQYENQLKMKDEQIEYY